MSEENNTISIELESLSKEDILQVQQIFQRFMNKYEENPERDTLEWLSEQLKEELPEKDETEIQKIAGELVESIEEYENDLSDLNDTCKKGVAKETWLANRLQDSVKGMSVNQYGTYLAQIDKAMREANAQMTEVIQSKGNCINLDGFIAEQYHVNNFNARAALNKSPYRARVCVPEHGYAKNSVDVMVDNIETGERGVERYQFKFGKNGEATSKLLAKGNYNNQRYVVPEGQVEEVKSAFPNKSVTDHIGGTEKVEIRSDSITKEELKQIQYDAQESGVVPKTDYNSYSTRELALQFGKEAGNAGIQAAFLGAGINIIGQALQGEPVDADEVVKTAIVTGSDTCVKTAAGGALKVASEKGILEILPPGTPAGIIAKIACVGVEDAKILWKVVKGELTMTEALEQMGRTSVSMYAGLSTGAVGAGIGAAALSVIPIVGPIAGGLIGGIVGYTAGSKFGECVFEGAKAVVKKGVELVGKAVETVGNIVSGVKDFLFGRI